MCCGSIFTMAPNISVYNKHTHRHKNSPYQSKLTNLCAAFMSINHFHSKWKATSVHLLDASYRKQIYKYKLITWDETSGLHHKPGEQSNLQNCLRSFGKHLLPLSATMMWYFCDVEVSLCSILPTIIPFLIKCK